jgi:hypothetical protein
MRSLLVACVVSMLLVASASAADLQQGQVSNQMLASMGMGGMQTISDVQGQQIRGKAWVIAGNFANVNVEHGGSVTIVQNLNVAGKQLNINVLNSLNGNKIGSSSHGRH